MTLRRFSSSNKWPNPTPSGKLRNTEYTFDWREKSQLVPGAKELSHPLGNIANQAYRVEIPKHDVRFRKRAALVIAPGMCRNLGDSAHTLESELLPSDARLLVATLSIGLLVGAAACTHADNQSAPGSAQIESDVVKKPMNLKGQIEFSTKDLANRLDVPLNTIRVSGARQVTWRSGALGCPEPGMTYTEALVPGSLIFLQADHTIYAYHGKIGREPFYCPRERAEQPVLDDSQDPT
jgi:hypothetical protein